MGPHLPRFAIRRAPAAENKVKAAQGFRGSFQSTRRGQRIAARKGGAVQKQRAVRAAGDGFAQHPRRLRRAHCQHRNPSPVRIPKGEAQFQRAFVRRVHPMCGSLALNRKILIETDFSRIRHLFDAHQNAHVFLPLHLMINRRKGPLNVPVNLESPLVKRLTLRIWQGHARYTHAVRNRILVVAENACRNACQHRAAQ